MAATQSKVLEHDDFAELVRGKVVRKLAAGSSDMVEVALADIGYDLMLRLIQQAMERK